MPILSWLGKEKVVNHHQQVPYRVLEAQYVHGQAECGNMLIHGDNLDALKSLLPRYEGKVKCVYIDPPYNTGNEGWVYNDNVNDPKIRKWLGEVVGKEGEDLSRHDKWLCMMYPRLKLLQRLLAEDGAIFISIDDIELSNLKMICNEIFGTSNFVCQFTWKTSGNFDNQAKIKICHEYILFYGKNAATLGLPQAIDPSIPETSKLYKGEIRNTVVKNGAKNPMSKITLPIGFPCSEQKMIVTRRFDKFPYFHNDAIIFDWRLTNEVVIESGWGSKDVLMDFIESGFQSVFDSKGQMTRFEITASGAIELIKTRDKISHVISVLTELGSTQNMSTELKKMGIVFDFPKPVQLVQYLTSFYCGENDILLDSFAGSGTTAHAVLNMNKNDGGNRKFILIEMENYAEAITAERIKRVINGYGDTEGTGGGFAYYELGDRLLFENSNLNETLAVEKIREYVWYTETRSDYTPQEEAYLLGLRANTAYYFYYEKQRVTVLDHDFLNAVKTKAGSYLIYADINTLSAKEMDAANIRFKKIPRDITKL